MPSDLTLRLLPTHRRASESSNSSCITCNNPSCLNANANGPPIHARCGTRELASPITKPEVFPAFKNYAALCFSLSFLIVARHAPYRKRGEYHGNRGEHRGVNEGDARVRSPDGGQGDLIQMVSRRKMRDPLRRFRQRKQKDI